MSADALQSVCGEGVVSPGFPTLPPLCATTLDNALVSNDLEHELRFLVTQHRRVSPHPYVPLPPDFSSRIYVHKDPDNIKFIKMNE